MAKPPPLKPSKGYLKFILSASQWICPCKSYKIVGRFMRNLCAVYARKVVQWLWAKTRLS
jgi:hypothetical protein